MKAHHAIAPEFLHVSAAPDLTIVFPTGTSPVTVNVPSGYYYMWLCPSSQCFLRRLQALTNIALGLAGRAETCVVQLSDDGVVTFAISGSPTSFTFGSWYRRIGLNAALVAGNFFTGTRPVWHLGLIAAATGNGWQPIQAGGQEQTTGGKVYTIAATNTSYSRALNIQFQPTDPTFKASLVTDATPMYPDSAYLKTLSGTSSTREWSILDVLYESRNSSCNVAIGNWLTVKESTSEGYHSDASPMNTLSINIRRLSDAWSAYDKWVLDLVWAGDVGTRA